MAKKRGAKKGTRQANLFKDIIFKCPECGEEKALEVPAKIIKQSNSVTAIGIPPKLICKHYFQTFVDKNFTVQGCQVGNFKIPHLEYYEGRGLDEDRDEEAEEFTSSPTFKEIVGILRFVVDRVEIIGSALFTPKGKVLYSSLPHSILFNTLNLIEIRNKTSLNGVVKIYLELSNHMKVCAEYINIKDEEFVVVLIFSKNVNFAISIIYLRDIIKRLNKQEKTKKFLFF